MEAFLRDVRYSLRSWARTPASTTVAILMLAIGIGASSAIFSVVEGVLLRTLPYRDADRLVTIFQKPVSRRGDSIPGGATNSDFAVAQVRASARSFEEVTEYFPAQPILTGLGEPVRVASWLVRSNFFPMLGVRPFIGRGFLPNEDEQGSESVVILGHAIWMSRFGGDPNALNRSITLDGQPIQIVGVMPPGFVFPPEVEMWRSLGTRRTSGPPRPFVQGGFRILGRLKPDVGLAQVQKELDAGYLAAAGNAPILKEWFANAGYLHQELVGTHSRPLWIMMGAVAILLVVACANVASLLLARTIARQREIATRLAIGASRARVTRQFLTESMLLAMVGGVCGIAIAVNAVPALLSLANAELPKATEIGINFRVLAVALGAVLATGFVCGLAPGLQAASYRTAASLKDGSFTTGPGRHRHRITSALIVLQIAMTMVLLTGASLLGTSFMKLMRVQPGFDTHHVITAEVRLSGQKYSSDASKLAFASSIVDEMRRIPGAETATVSGGMPLAGGAIGSMDIDGKPVEQPWAWITMATDSFFDVYRIPILRGRRFADALEVRDAVIVNAAFVRAFSLGPDPIGHRVKFFGTTEGTIIGVAGDTHQENLRESPPPQIYPALELSLPSYFKLSVRTSGRPEDAGAFLRQAIHAVDPMLPIDKMTTLDTMLWQTTLRLRFYATLLNVFALLALAMAVAGIYSVASYAAARRTSEMGIRIAIGATPRALVALMLTHGVWLIAAGVSMGTLLAIGATRLVESFLFGTTPTDPTVFVAAALLIALASLAAYYLPARRAARVSPLLALRFE